MLKPLLGVAATGIAAVLAWKLLGSVMLPLLGLAIGLVAFMFNAACIRLAVLIGFWIFRRMTREESVTA